MLKLAWKYMRYYKSQTLAIFASILLTAALLSGIGSLIYSSQKNDLANSKTIHGDWHYYIETEPEQLQAIVRGGQEEQEGSGSEKGRGKRENGYQLRRYGTYEIRDVVSEEFLIYFVRTDETYRQMVHRDLLKGKLPKKENEIAADAFVLSNLGFSGNPGDPVRIGEREFVVTGVLKSEWAADSDKMEIFVSDAFAGRGSQMFLYLGFAEEEKLYKQLDAFLRAYKISSDTVKGNDEVIQYLGGEEPASIYEIVKFGLTDEEGNFTYIVLKLQSDYNLAYNGMIVLLCLFSIFVIYSVFNISVSKRTSEYGILQALGISGGQICGTLILELWMLFFAGYPLGCLMGNGILSLIYQKFSGVFGGKGVGVGVTEKGLSVADQTLAEGVGAVHFYLSWDAMLFGFGFLFAALGAAALMVVRSLGKQSLKEVMSGDTSFTRRRKIYALRPAPDMAGVVVQKFMFANKKKVAGILLSLSVGGCIFLCTTYMTENLKVHAELSLKSDDGLGSQYRVSLKSNSLSDTIPESAADQIKNIPGTKQVYAAKFTFGEVACIEELEWDSFFEQQNAEDYFVRRYGGICLPQEDGAYKIKYDVYGYEEEMIRQLSGFTLEGEVDPQDLKNGNKIIAVALMDGQGNYYFYGKKPGDTITLRVPRMDGYTDKLLKFQSGEENYIEKEFEIAAIVSRPLAREQGFLQEGVYQDALMNSLIMTNEQMEENFGIIDYNFIHASLKEASKAEEVSGQILKVIRDVPKAVLQDYISAIETQKNYLKQQQVFFTSIAVILLVISLFHIANSMNYTILARRREYGIIRAMGITDGGFYKMILQTGILYGVLADVFIFLTYNHLLRRGMDYYMAHVLKFLHRTAGVPNLVWIGILLLNVGIAAAAVLFPAWKMMRENIISEIAR